MIHQIIIEKHKILLLADRNEKINIKMECSNCKIKSHDFPSKEINFQIFKVKLTLVTLDYLDDEQRLPNTLLYTILTNKGDIEIMVNRCQSFFCFGYLQLIGKIGQE